MNIENTIDVKTFLFGGIIIKKNYETEEVEGCPTLRGDSEISCYALEDVIEFKYAIKSMIENYGWDTEDCYTTDLKHCDREKTQTFAMPEFELIEQWYAEQLEIRKNCKLAGSVKHLTLSDLIASGKS